MTLTLQFLIVLTLPLSFLLLAVYTFAAGIHRPRVGRYWLLTLFIAALWSSSLLSYYGGLTFTPAVAYTWQVAGKYALSLTSLALLLTTTRYLLTPVEHTRLVLGFGLFLWLAALILDPAVWGEYLLPFPLAGETVNQFILWAAVWPASWFVPLLAAWLLTRQAYFNSPGAIYRNQLAYWVLMLALFTLGGAIALVQQPGQPLWQQIGALVQIVAAALGAYHLIRAQLPDLRLTLRRLSIRLAASALVFALAVLALWVLTQIIPRRSSGNVSLDLILGALAFTAAFMLVNRLAGRIMTRLFLPPPNGTDRPLPDQPEVLSRLDTPEKLGQTLLQHVQANLSTEAGCVYLLDAGGSRNLTLFPVACLGQRPGTPLTFAQDSPFVQHLQRHPPRPLAQYDLESLEMFAGIDPQEQKLLTGLQHELYVPLHAGKQLVGLLGLGNKLAGGAYSYQDFDWLQEMSAPAGLLLVQAGRLSALSRRYEQQIATWEATRQRNRHLEALHDLYDKLASMITPDLRRPVVVISNHLQEHDERTNGTLTLVKDQLMALRLPLESLVALAARLRGQNAFRFQSVYVGEITRQVEHNLHNMAEARRVTIAIDVPPHLPPLAGDPERLVEALQHVVHNAIKFNKIGGEVEITADVVSDALCIRVRDSGVGIPPDRLEQIWLAYRGDSTDRYGSTTPSMGLLLSRYIVEAHGGYITVESEHGVGSTFFIHLPVAETAGETATP